MVQLSIVNKSLKKSATDITTNTPEKHFLKKINCYKKFPAGNL